MSSNFAHSCHSRLFGLEQSCFSLSGSAVMLSTPGDFSPFRLRTALFVRSAASLVLVCFQGCLCPLQLDIVHVSLLVDYSSVFFEKVATAAFNYRIVLTCLSKGL